LYWEGSLHFVKILGDSISLLIILVTDWIRAP
jgi:hypothetical protein